MDRVLVVDKPAGLTSHDVVNRLRRSTRVRRVGHAGTLDPSATGVLVVLVGKATRLMQFLVETDKEYVGRLVLGVSTDTHDADGEVQTESPVGAIGEDDLRRVFSEFTGEQDQVPPMTSAIKRDGRPLYELARKGIVVDREPRKIIVHRLELLAYEPPEAEFVLECSKGTYVRKLAHDVGERLSVGGHLGNLARTRVGRFRLKDALPLAELEAVGTGIGDTGLSMFEALSGWPELVLDDHEAETVVFGGAVVVDPARLSGSAEADEDASVRRREGSVIHVRLTRDGETLAAVGKVKTSGPDGVTVRPVKVFESV